MRTPLLSVLIDTYNHEKYIEQCVLSAIEQDFPASDYEIVVVDDGSTDRTPEIVRKFAPRVRLLRKKNGGQASAFNAALPELRGDIVAFLDGDDWFAPGKLTAVTTALEQHPEAAAVGHGYYEFFEESGGRTAHVLPAPRVLDLRRPEVARGLFYGLLGWVLMGALTVRTRVLRRLPRIPETLVFCADNPIAIGALAGGVYIIDRPLFYYRQHSDNLCASGTEDEKRARQRYEMYKVIFDVLEPLLAQLEIPVASKEALLSCWPEISRSYLQKFGGTRMDAFRTEMAAFRWESEKPTLGYRLFKWGAVGSATVLLPPRVFYRVRDWYGRRNLGRIREQFARSR